MAARPKDVRLVCGLGNPGSEYAATRHNIGFATVDVVAARMDVHYWKDSHGCLVAQVKASGRDVFLVKPQDFMNTSGGPLSKLARAERIQPAEILVVHDEVDLPTGEVRVKWGGGLNAHNGLRSVADKLGTRDFARVRCGIGRPPGKMDVATYVLRTLRGSFLDEFEATAEHAADVVEDALAHGVPLG